VTLVGPVPAGARLATLTGHDDYVTTLAVTTDGSLLASGSFDRTIKLWSLPDGALLKTLEGHRDRVQALALTPDGTLLASGGDDRTVKLWSLPGGDMVTSVEAHADAVRALVATPDGTLLVSGGADAAIKLWSLPTGEFSTCLMDLAANEESVRGVTYQVETASGETVITTQPCGAPIPSGAVCLCNCVLGSYVKPCECVGHTSGTSGGHYWHPC